MRNFINNIVRLYGAINNTGLSLTDFIMGKKRKGGDLRRKIGGKLSRQYLNSDPKNFIGTSNIWGENIRQIERDLLELNFGLWGISNLSSDYKNFLFNLVQGRLYLNNVRHHIYGTDRHCTFCLIEAKKNLANRGILEESPEYAYYLNLQPVETVNHIFWECEQVQLLIQRSYRWILGLDWYRGNEEIQKNSFLMGILHPNRGLCQTDLIWKHYVKFFIINCKYKNRIPKFPSFRYEFEGVMSLPNMNKFVREIRNLHLLYN